MSLSIYGCTLSCVRVGRASGGIRLKNWIF